MNENQIDKIPFIEGLENLSSGQRNAELIEKGFSGNVDKINWEEFSYKPPVEFRLAHDNNKLFILYRVDEQNVKATYLKDNDAVWEDSCVEAFISPDPEKGYLNFEFTCIGTALAGYGEGRENRKHWEAAKMNQIQRVSSLNKDIVGKEGVDAKWWLQVAIPFDLLNVKRGQTIFTNFYKCGDGTKQPHFLSWQPIDTPQPDFHRPEFFGKLILE